MTPQLQQAIKLLQLSNIELAEYCEAELEKNPLLERDDSAPPRRANAKRSQIARRSERADESPGPRGFLQSLATWTRRRTTICMTAATRAAPPAAVARQPLTDWTTVKSGGGLKATRTARISLAGERYAQGPSRSPARHRRAERRRPPDLPGLIDAIDEAGYLRADLPDLAQRLGTEMEDVQAVLGVLQGFDPVGVGARDLAECLALQLKAHDRLDPAMQALLTRLDLLARRDMAQLTQLCGVDAEDIADMIAEIRSLNPKPGLAFGTEPVTPVVPDVFVRVGPDGAWLVELNSDTLPRLLVNPRITPRSPRAPATRTPRTISPTASTTPTGWSRAWTSAPAPS